MYFLFIMKNNVRPKKCEVKVKLKFHPRRSHESPEGEEMYSSNLSLISALDVGGWSTPRFGGITSGNDPVPMV